MALPNTVALSENKKQIPALSDHAVLRYFNFIALYVAQGIPEGIMAFGIPAWMAMNGKSAGEIGSFVAAIGLPWSFKIVIAPLMDRFTYLPMGKRRPWVLIGQLGLVISFFALAFVPDPLNNLSLFMTAGFFVGCFGAFQDVATDGMAIDVVPVNEQAKANGFMWGAKIIGTSGSLALGSSLIHHYGFKVAILSLASLVMLIMLVPLCLRERKGEKIFPWSQGKISPETAALQPENWRVILKSLLNVFKLRDSIFLTFLLFFSSLSFNFISTLLPIFTVKELGWTDVSYSQFYASSSLIGGLTGMLIGGFLLEKFGKKKVLHWCFVVMSIITMGLGMLKFLWPEKWLISTYMILFKTLYVFASIGVFAIAMQFCWKKVSATQFTLYMTLGNLGRMAGAKIIGPVHDHFSWQYCLYGFILLLGLGWIFLFITNIKQQEKAIENLERKG